MTTPTSLICSVSMVLVLTLMFLAYLQVGRDDAYLEANPSQVDP